jgi:hypothetical protein
MGFGAASGTFSQDKDTGMTRTSCGVAAIASLLTSLISAAPASAQQIWFSPRSGPAYADEFYRLFDRDAPWQHAASHVAAFELSIQLETSAPDEQLKKVIAGLQERHIPLALDMLPLTGRPDHSCGQQVEGYAAAGQSAMVARHFKSLGAQVAYYDMDEPLFYGHFFNGANACHSAIAELASDVAAKVKQVQAEYPDAQIGETEPVMAVTKQGLAELEQWLDAYQAATGKPLAFFRFDMDWNAPWQRQVDAVAKLLRRKGVKLQVIYNGSDRDGSDEQWTAHALGNARAIESVVRPDAIVIQSWATYPKRFLPESDPHSMTGLINGYSAIHGAH